MFRYRRAINEKDQTPSDGDYELFSGRPLQIFEPNASANSDDLLQIWSKCDKHSLFLASALPPKDYFEKMIYWTMEGKIWQFPIDNEQGKWNMFGTESNKFASVFIFFIFFFVLVFQFTIGMCDFIFSGLGDEHNVSFSEHVFLDEHLEPWCPRKGAMRNFMELVCIGLSKNPYLTVQQKTEHIEWYRRYFEEYNKSLLNDGSASSSSQLGGNDTNAKKLVSSL